MLGGLEALKIAQDETFKLMRSAAARLEEADRREREFQRDNLQLARENRDLHRELRDLVKEAREENARALTKD